MPSKNLEESRGERKHSEPKPDGPHTDSYSVPSPIKESTNTPQVNGEKTLKDAIKPKNKRRKRASSKTDAS